MIWDWSMPPALGWFLFSMLIGFVVVMLVIEVADWCDGHHDFVVRHTPHWFDDPE